MPLVERRRWVDPRRYARAIDPAREHWVLLYSGADVGFSGRYSILATDPTDIVEADDFDALAARLSADRPRWDNAWFGFATYELAATLEQVPIGLPPPVAAPGLAFVRYRCVLVFDHRLRHVDLYANPPSRATAAPAAEPRPASAAEPAPDRAISAGTSLDRAAHRRSVERILGSIRAGDLYQANLTRKISGALEPTDTTGHPGLGLFLELARANPAPYSAYLRHGGLAVISSSPERFLKMEADGTAESRPIKGTIRRETDERRDSAARRRLESSEKDRAENLMIVDLVRNDLGRIAVPGSVTAADRMRLESFATVHHLVSTIRAIRRPEVEPIDVVRACFPPGSMTGAPKIAAMRICTALEGVARGIYSGTLGWFGGDGSADLSVVIRTIVIRDDDFELGVGGGIVADSDPDHEWQETISKARALCTALGISSE